MSPSGAYKVAFRKAAAKQVRSFDQIDADRIKAALSRLAARVGTSPGSRGGKSVKQIRGRHERFERLRAGELRIMLELLHEERVVLVHAIVNRRDLDRWLRTRRSS